jgi:hypothetical protein
VLTLRSKTVFAGGILTGIGLSAYAFGLWIWWLLSRMYILSVSKPRVLIAIIILPAAMVASGVWLASRAKERGEQT